MPTQKKATILEEIKEKIKRSKSITIVEYQGLKVNDLNNLRRKIRQGDAETVIIKNTLLKKALRDEGIGDEEIQKGLVGATAAIFSYNDPVGPIKTVFEFSKELELPKVKFSYIEGMYASADKTEKISQLPSKEQLISQVLGGLKAPLNGIVYVLAGTPKKLVTVLSKIAEQKK